MDFNGNVNNKVTFNFEDNTDLYGSCTVFYRGDWLVFGGNYQKRQVLTVTPCFRKICVSLKLLHSGEQTERLRLTQRSYEYSIWFLLWNMWCVQSWYWCRTFMLLLQRLERLLEVSTSQKVRHPDKSLRCRTSTSFTFYSCKYQLDFSVSTVMDSDNYRARQHGRISTPRSQTTKVNHLLWEDLNLEINIARVSTEYLCR